MNRVRLWLPILLALSGNSPFWQGLDTGFDSYRMQVWQRWPTSGMPPELDERTRVRRAGARPGDDRRHRGRHVPVLVRPPVEPLPDARVPGVRRVPHAGGDHRARRARPVADVVVCPGGQRGPAHEHAAARAARGRRLASGPLRARGEPHLAAHAHATPGPRGRRRAHGVRARRPRGARRARGGRGDDGGDPRPGQRRPPPAQGVEGRPTATARPSSTTCWTRRRRRTPEPVSPGRRARRRGRAAPSGRHEPASPSPSRTRRRPCRRSPPDHSPSRHPA